VRKDGAPTGVADANENKSLGHPPFESDRNLSVIGMLRQPSRSWHEIDSAAIGRFD
jgi:hypothetical protein